MRNGLSLFFPSTLQCWKKLLKTEHNWSHEHRMDFMYDVYYVIFSYQMKGNSALRMNNMHNCNSVGRGNLSNDIYQTGSEVFTLAQPLCAHFSPSQLLWTFPITPQHWKIWRNHFRNSQAMQFHAQTHRAFFSQPNHTICYSVQSQSPINTRT